MEWTTGATFRLREIHDGRIVARNAGFTNSGGVDLVVFSFTPADLSAEPAEQ